MRDRTSKITSDPDDGADGALFAADGVSARPQSHAERVERVSWCVGPRELAAVARDDALLDRLAAGYAPNPADPAAVALAAWLAEVVDGAAGVTR